MVLNLMQSRCCSRAYFYSYFYSYSFSYVRWKTSKASMSTRKSMSFYFSKVITFVWRLSEADMANPALARSSRTSSVQR